MENLNNYILERLKITSKTQVISDEYMDEYIELFGDGELMKFKDLEIKHADNESLKQETYDKIYQFINKENEVFVIRDATKMLPKSKHISKKLITFIQTHSHPTNHIKDKSCIIDFFDENQFKHFSDLECKMILFKDFTDFDYVKVIIIIQIIK